MGDAIIVLGGPDLRRLVSMEDTIAAVREAFVATARGEAAQPPRIALDGGRELAMLARVGGRGGGAAAKLLSIHAENREKGRPTIQGVVIWFDADGAPAAVLEGTTVTALRTGAASGVATDLLAPPGTSTLGIVGAGAQAWDQVMAVAAVRRLREVRVASAGPASRLRLAERLAAALGASCAVRAVDSARAAVAGADVVVTATPATEPLFALDDLAPECHVNAVGSYRPGMRELPGELLANASLVAVDQLEAAREEAGEIIAAVDAGLIAWDRVVEIGALLDGPAPARRGRTVFKSVGIAAQDWALARLAVARAGADAPRVELPAG